MQTTVIDERKLQSIDRKITNYLSAIAGRHPRRFCSPRIESIRFCAAWAMPDDFIRERLAHLVAIGRIDRATEVVGGVEVEGFRVLPNRIFDRAQRAPISDELELTPADCEFFRACGIALPVEHVANLLRHREKTVLHGSSEVCPV